LPSRLPNGNRRSRDQPSAAEPYVVESGIPGRVQGLRSRGGTCPGLLAVCPARSVHRDRGALRDADFDLLTVVCAGWRGEGRRAGEPTERRFWWIGSGPGGRSGPVSTWLLIHGRGTRSIWYARRRYGSRLRRRWGGRPTLTWYNCEDDDSVNPACGQPAQAGATVAFATDRRVALVEDHRSCEFALAVVAERWGTVRPDGLGLSRYLLGVLESRGREDGLDHLSADLGSVAFSPGCQDDGVRPRGKGGPRSHPVGCSISRCLPRAHETSNGQPSPGAALASVGATYRVTWTISPASEPSRRVWAHPWAQSVYACPTLTDTKQQQRFPILCSGIRGERHRYATEYVHYDL